jgi:hypothetical protein
MTLTQAAALTKKGILYLIALILAGFLTWTLFKVGTQIYLTLRPPVEKPEMKFGALTKIQFPESTISSSGFTYSVDTNTGDLPTKDIIIKVYFIPRNGVSLLAPERAQKNALKLGYIQGPEVLSSNLYKFTDSNSGFVTIDLTTGNFHLQRQPVSKTKDAGTSTEILNQSKLVSDFKSYLSGKDYLTADLSNGRTSVIFNGSSSAEAETADVSIWPADIDNLSVVTPVYKTALVRATVGKEDLTDKFLKVDYTYWAIDKNTFSTYPLKTTKEAFEDLKKGQGYVSYAPNSKQISISSVNLAYYQSEDYTSYLQPVFVFEGPNFAALVPAIKY